MIRLFATFRYWLPQDHTHGSLRLEVDEQQSPRTLLHELGIPDDLARIVLVNGVLTWEDSPLHEGDVVSVFPPLIGGRGDIVVQS